MTQIKSFIHKGFEIEPIGKVKENYLVKINGSTFIGYQYQDVTLEGAVNAAKKHIDEYLSQTTVLYKGYELRILDEHEGKVRLFIPDSEFDGKAYGFALYEECLHFAQFDINAHLKKTKRKSKTEHYYKPEPKPSLLDLYTQWLKETNRGGGILLGKSVREFIEYAQSKL